MPGSCLYSFVEKCQTKPTAFSLSLPLVTNNYLKNWTQ